MKDRLKKILAIALVTVIAVPLTSAPALAGGYRHDDRGHYSNRGYHHGNRYSSNQVWAAVGVGLLGGALVLAAMFLVETKEPETCCPEGSEPASL